LTHTRVVVELLALLVERDASLVVVAAPTRRGMPPVLLRPGGVVAPPIFLGIDSIVPQQTVICLSTSESLSSGASVWIKSPEGTPKQVDEEDLARA
jgi:hypothetical protein